MEDETPEGALIDVKVQVRLPASATDRQIEEWLNFNLLQQGSISGDNPLVDESVEEFGNSLSWDDTGLKGYREEYDHDHTETGISYKVRYVRERR